MGGATTTRFIMTTLLTTPFPPLRPSLHLLRRSLSVPPFLTLSKIKTRRNHYQQQLVTCFHSHSHSNDTNTNTYTDTRNSSASSQQNHHPWPEWTSFLNILSNANSDNGISPDDAFVVYEQLQDQFVRAAASCLAFARDRPNFIGSLSRRDIEAVVSNGTPFLFRSAIDTARRMRAFLASDVSIVLKILLCYSYKLMKGYTLLFFLVGGLFVFRANTKRKTESGICMSLKDCRRQYVGEM